MKVYIPALTLSFLALPSTGYTFAGALLRGEHCTGVCDIVEYSCDLKDQAKITPSDMLKRDAGKIARTKSKGYTPEQMRAYCIKSCFHKDPWNRYKANPQQYFAKLCAPTAAVAIAEDKLKAEEESFLQPFVPENKAFKYKVQSTSNQITPLSIKLMDRNFVTTTGGGIARAVGSAELMILVLASLNGQAVHTMSDDQKLKLARDLMKTELTFSPADQKEYLEKGTMSVDALTRVLESVRMKLYQKKGINPSHIHIPGVK